MFEIGHWEQISRFTEVTSGEQAAFFIINLFIIIVGFFGNAAVLLGSIKYKALKMDKISLVLVQNIAAADMIIVLLRYIPTSITLLAKKWVFGKVGCFFLGFMANVPSCTEIITITLLSLHRLMVLKQTPSQRLLNFESKLRACKLIIVGSWLFMIGLWLVTAFVGFDVIPGPRATTCVIGFSWYDSETKHIFLTGFMLAVGLVIPMAVIFLVNSYILYAITRSSLKSHSNIPTKVLATIPLICLVYFGSYICSMFYTSFVNFSKSDSLTSIQFYTVIHYLESISVLANPAIYCIRDEFRVFMCRLATFNLSHYSLSPVSEEDNLTPNPEQKSEKQLISPANANKIYESNTPDTTEQHNDSEAGISRPA